jgi:DNA-binding response OmpR family regulator
MARRVLVADDDPMTGTVLSAVLSERGFEALLAADRDEVRRVVDDRRPDAVVLGGALARGADPLAGLPSDLGAGRVPVVLLSPATDVPPPHDPLGPGVEARLQRPCSPLHLVEVLESLVGGDGGPAPAALP